MVGELHAKKNLLQQALAPGNPQLGSSALDLARKRIQDKSGGGAETAKKRQLVSDSKRKSDQLREEMQREMKVALDEANDDMEEVRNLHQSISSSVTCRCCR